MQPEHPACTDSSHRAGLALVTMLGKLTQIPPILHAQKKKFPIEEYAETDVTNPWF